MNLAILLLFLDENVRLDSPFTHVCEWQHMLRAVTKVPYKWRSCFRGHDVQLPIHLLLLVEQACPVLTERLYAAISCVQTQCNTMDLSLRWE